MAGLEDLYREIILDHYRTPRNRGELEAPAVSAEGHNPLCGDEIRIFIDVKDGLVSEVRFNGSGCSISQSSASMMTTAVKGKPVDQVRGKQPLGALHAGGVGGERGHGQGHPRLLSNRSKRRLHVRDCRTEAERFLRKG